MRPTNLLVIMADEHHPSFLGCAGHPVVRTPHLDRLAARGTRFAHAYTSMPICVPARASLATGRYPHQLGLWDNTTPYTGTEAPSWGHRLTERGHHVTTIGKLHYRRPEDPSGFPDQRIPLHVHAGEGDLYGLLRDRTPPRPRQRAYLHEAGAGDSEYLRYDRGVAEHARHWLREEAPGHDRPWALFVSFVSPHPPFVAPPEYLALYPPESVVLPVNWQQEAWTRHPALEVRRRILCLEEPLDEATLRRAIAAYYALCTFVDAQIGSVLQALEEQGLDGDTRIVYTSDHGDMVGEHGLWYKGTMYESSVGIPMIVAGPDTPAGKVSRTNVSSVDLFPAALEAVGIEPAPEDADLPGESLFTLANEPDRARIVFSEYHAGASPSGIFMIRGERYKYVYYAGYPAALFDMEDDPGETRNLAEDPAYAEIVAALDRELRSICDPDAVDARARAEQARRIEAAGGVDLILSTGPKFTHSPPPEEFADPPEIAKRR